MMGQGVSFGPRAFSESTVDGSKVKWTEKETLPSRFFGVKATITKIIELK